MTQRTRAVATTVGLLAHAGQPAFALPPLLDASKPLPPLPPQVLVNLLKHPCCVAMARRAVLDQLARRYGRPFADQWDFVRFAAEQHSDLDLTSAPTRPLPSDRN